MALKGFDAASEPSVAQVQAAIAAGYSWAAFYVAGPGAFHNWSSTGINALRQGGMTRGLPIYVPAMSGGLIASTTPESDAQSFVSAYTAQGVTGAGVLDTEASMRGNAWTATYEQRFSAEMRTLGQADVCYAGGFTMSAPPTATYKWWIVASSTPPAAQCYQAGQDTISGLSVDVDWADTAFPLAILATQTAVSDGGSMLSFRPGDPGQRCDLGYVLDGTVIHAVSGGLTDLSGAGAAIQGLGAPSGRKAVEIIGWSWDLGGVGLNIIILCDDGFLYGQWLKTDNTSGSGGWVPMKGNPGNGQPGVPLNASAGSSGVGPQGPPGPQGPAGPVGPQGPSGKLVISAA